MCTTIFARCFWVAMTQKSLFCTLKNPNCAKMTVQRGRSCTPRLISTYHGTWIHTSAAFSSSHGPSVMWSPSWWWYLSLCGRHENCWHHTQTLRTCTYQKVMDTYHEKFHLLKGNELKMRQKMKVVGSLWGNVIIEVHRVAHTTMHGYRRGSQASWPATFEILAFITFDVT